LVYLSADDKLQLARFVKKAKGSLSLDEFAQKTGVSKYQLSRIMNGKFKEQPRISTMAAIADNSESTMAETCIRSLFLLEDNPKKEKTVQPDSLHSDCEPEKNTSEIMNDIENAPETTKRYRTQKSWDSMAVILYFLVSLPFEWTKKNLPCPVNVFVNGYLCIDLLGQTKIRRWHFFFLKQNPYDYPTYLIAVAGILCDKGGSADEKFSIVTDSEYIFKAPYISHDRLSGIILSVILIHPNNELSEVYIHSDLNAPKEDVDLLKLKKNSLI